MYNLVITVLVITSKFSSTYYGVCMCDFPWCAPHVLPNFGLSCLVHCPSVLVVNCSGYGCDAGFVFFSDITGGLRYVHGLQIYTYYLFPSCQSFKVYVCPREAGSFTAHRALFTGGEGITFHTSGLSFYSRREMQRLYYSFHSSSLGRQYGAKEDI
jgi:hypothetical protein